MYQLIYDKHVVARKLHYCEWCNEKIINGEKYYKRVYVFDGVFTYGKMHLECEQAMDNSNYDGLQDGWIPGEPKRGEAI